jgi:hypothetical protein
MGRVTTKALEMGGCEQATGGAAAREKAERRLVDALRRLIADDLSIRESAGRVGVAYHAARSLIRAADVSDAARDEDVGGQI